jgi:hypothetical protein
MFLRPSMLRRSNVYHFLKRNRAIPDLVWASHMHAGASNLRPSDKRVNIPILMIKILINTETYS